MSTHFHIIYAKKLTARIQGFGLFLTPLSVVRKQSGLSQHAQNHLHAPNRYLPQSGDFGRAPDLQSRPVPHSGHCEPDTHRACICAPDTWSNPIPVSFAAHYSSHTRHQMYPESVPPARLPDSPRPPSHSLSLIHI